MNQPDVYLFIYCLRDKYLFYSFWHVKSCLCELPEYMQPGPFSVNPGVLISCDSFKLNLINQTAKPRPEKDIITIRNVSQAAVRSLSQTEKPHWRKIKAAGGTERFLLQIRPCHRLKHILFPSCKMPRGGERGKVQGLQKGETPNLNADCAKNVLLFALEMFWYVTQ